MNLTMIQLNLTDGRTIQLVVETGNGAEICDMLLAGDDYTAISTIYINGVRYP